MHIYISVVHCANKFLRCNFASEISIFLESETTCRPFVRLVRVASAFFAVSRVSGTSLKTKVKKEERRTRGTRGGERERKEEYIREKKAFQRGWTGAYFLCYSGCKFHICIPSRSHFESQLSYTLLLLQFVEPLTFEFKQRLVKK